MTWVAAVAVAAVSVFAALYVADRLTPSNRQSAARAPALPRMAAIPLPPSQSVERKAESAHTKTARLKTGDKIETLMTPGLFEPGILETPGAWAPIESETGEEGGAPPETGRASWYDLDSETASGEVMDGDALTAAHPSLPLGTKVRVENLDNGRAVVVRINDRGPFAKDRIIDLSKAAAVELGMIENGVARVSVSPAEGVVASAIKASAGALPLQR